MTTYALYLESGSRHKKTMAHLFEPLGCCFSGPTTEATIAGAEAGIREYLRFLASHGAPIDPGQPIETTVAAHVTDGVWLGNGDPTSGFEPDFAPLSADEVAEPLHRLQWMHDDLMTIVARVPSAKLDDSLVASPTWTLRRFLSHIAMVEGEYVRCALDKPDGYNKLVGSLEKEGADPGFVLPAAFDQIHARLSAISPGELNRETQRGAKTWTVRRCLRRTLEHRWEHLTYLRRLLD